MSMFKSALRAVTCCALLIATHAYAAEVTSADEYNKRLKIWQTVSPGGDTPFGEQINLYTGELTFRQTDISFPGIGPDISITRFTRSSQDERVEGALAFGNWDISLPRIETLVTPAMKWKVGDSEANPTSQRCTYFGQPYIADGWNGMTLVTADGDRQPVLKRSAQYTTKPALTENGQPVAFTAITNANWQIGCLANTTAGDPVGQPGEAFLAVSADGTKYYLTHLVYTEADVLRTRDEFSGQWVKTFRNLARMYVSKIVDRFGNTLTFTYDATDPRKLARIVASDGRTLAFTWRTDVPVIASITMQATDATPRTWQYQYGDVTSTNAGLSGVILPDGSSWQFGGIVGAYIMPPADGNGGATLSNCSTRDASQLPTFGSMTGTVVSPSGLTGTFEVRGTWNGRSYVPSACYQSHASAPVAEGVPQIFGTHALTKRTISGAGIAAQTWTYAYSPAQGSALRDACAAAGTCAETAWVDATDPEGNRTRHTFSTRWGAGEGRSLKVETYEGTSTLLRTETFAYASSTQGPWPAKIGISLDEATSNIEKQETWAPMSARNIAQQGVNFYWAATAFDQYAKPTTETRQTTGGPLKTDTTTYHHATAKWVIGQVAQTTSQGDTFTTPVITSRITYTDDLPTTFREFEKIRQTVSYNADGTVNTVADGRGLTTTFSSWYRGIPRAMAFADTTTKSATVNDLGQITSVTDENGFRTCYAFDAIGRLSQITYPSDTAGQCDTGRWNPLVRSFAPRAANDPDLEFGLGPNHWIERVSTGNGHSVTHYDALWRSVVVERYDATDAATKAATFTRTATRYDSSGAALYQSYPTKNLTTYLTVAPGTKTTYDALGRPTRIEQDSELGQLVSTTRYLAGFTTEATNARHKVATTTYRTFDQPATDWPLTIVQPEGDAYTIIARDLFGKPLSITRRNGDASVITTRTYTYNTAQELCRTVEPETGSTLMGYDAAGNLAWSASGYSAGTGCVAASAVAGRRSDRTYDQRNRLVDLSFADDLGEQTLEYTPDGLPRILTAYNGTGRTLPVITSYAYNTRRMVGGQGETSQQEGWYLFSLGAGYDRNGALTNHVYTGGEVVDYAPNALGQATRVGNYANSVSYHPNGAVASFNYGNGLGHALTQNLRQLPERSRDAFGSNVVLDDSYDYDENGNVVAISDALPGNRGNRDMGYDGLDRLVSATSSMFGGTIAYTYDVLDNLSTVSGGGRDLRYCYNASTKRLEFLRTQATNCFTGSATTSFGFDVQGNLAWKNGQNFTFGHDNRLRESVGMATYRYDALGRRVSANNPTAGGNIISMYSQDGLLRRTTDGRRSKVAHYMYLAGSLVAVREQDFSGNLLGIKYQHTDALGTPVAVTDAATNVIERSEYEPYGKLLNRPIGDGPGFTGHVQDADSGLTYMQQRYYDPAIGQFLSVDPVATDASGGFNRYRYANQNPYKNYDPDGRATTCVQKECKTTADTFDATKSSGRTIVATADEKAFVDNNKDVVRARTGPEKSAVLTSSNGELALTNRTTGSANGTVQLLNGKLPEGSEALVHGHTERGKGSINGFVDAPEKNNGYGDSAPLAYGVPGATVFGSAVAWREMVGGQLTMSYPVGSVDSSQLEIIQANLNSEQLLFQSK